MELVTGLNKPLRGVHKMAWTNEGRQTLLELVNRRFNVARDPDGDWVVTHGRIGLEERAICERGPDLAIVGQKALRILERMTGRQ